MGRALANSFRDATPTGTTRHAGFGDSGRISAGRLEYARPARLNPVVRRFLAISSISIAGFLVGLGGCSSSDRGAGEAGPTPDSARISVPPAPAEPHGTTPASASIRIARPQPGDTVSSPVIVAGKARGPWFFEATFPVLLLDRDGRTLAAAPARAQGEWTTPDWVPFRDTLEVRAPDAAGPVRLVLDRANPSGLPEHAGRVVIPIHLRSELPPPEARDR